MYEGIRKGALFSCTSHMLEYRHRVTMAMAVWAVLSKKAHVNEPKWCYMHYSLRWIYRVRRWEPPAQNVQGAT